MSSQGRWFGRATAAAQARYASLREPFWALASQVLNSGCNFLTSLILIRAAGLLEFGRFAVCFIFLMLTRKFLVFVFLAPMSSILPSIGQADRPSYYGFLRLAALAFAIVSSTILVAPIVPYSWALDAPWLPALGLSLFVSNAMVNLADFVRRFLLDRGRVVSSFMVDCWRFGLQLALLLYFAFVSPSLLDTATALWIIAASSTVGVVFGIVVDERVQWRLARFKHFWSRHRHFAGWTSITTVLETIENIAPLLIANAILGETATGILRALQQLSNILNLPFNALLQSMPGMAARKYAAAGSARLHRFLWRMTALASAGVIGVSLVVLAASDLLITQLLRIDDPQAVTIFLAYVVLNVCMLLKLPVMIAVNVLGVPRLAVWPHLFGALFTIGGSFLVMSLIGPITVPLLNAGGLLLTMLLILSKIRGLDPGGPGSPASALTPAEKV